MLAAARFHPRFDPRRLTIEFALGFLYWLAFVLILEPGNLMRWTPPDSAAWGREGLRLAGAGLLGAAATPAIVAAARMASVRRGSVLRRVAAHLAFVVVATLGLIAASCLLARLLPHHIRRPLIRDVGTELLANGLLVAAWIAGLTVLVHAIRPAAALPASIAFRQRGRVTRLDLAEVAWIESQGNYLAIHGARGVRLVRATAKELERELDTAGFIRIHRRLIIALAAVESVAPRASGDAEVRLRTGEVLRVSRQRRAQLLEALAREAGQPRFSTGT